MRQALRMIALDHELSVAPSDPAKLVKVSLQAGYHPEPEITRAVPSVPGADGSSSKGSARPVPTTAMRQ